ncbi:hypothetical protein OG205_33400 [Lentzea sp. NBC_00516]|uniref:hypothetical protein n=1 Tax=Lentzea sp. NBC_00516 TaxID=2903582 RepID=UPI002E824A57|nr:hypothetical protein [Lentzea sp. NBC_00516]WUD22935.1 hypothetical protein OG205_33400 [Lentzea sp. NBC_00516]
MNGRIAEWMRDGGAVAVTLAGIALYVALRLPSAIFYARLGTTPEAAGITYLTLLTGSTLGAGLTIAVSGLMVLLLAAAAVYVATAVKAVVLVGHIVAMRRVASNRLHDEYLERVVAAIESLWSTYGSYIEQRSGATLDFLKQDLTRRFELGRLGVRTHSQQQELDERRARWTTLFSLRDAMEAPGHLSTEWLVLNGKRTAIIVAFFAIFAGLPLFAFAQAREVMQARQDLGSKFGLFAYSAQPVRIDIASKEAPPTFSPYVGKDLFLIGQNAQQVVLYFPAERRTLMFPANAVQISTR